MPLAKLASAIVADLKIIPTNCVTNNDSISDGQNLYSSVRGFVGVQSVTSNDLMVGIAWGRGKTLNNIVVQISPVSTSVVSIAYLEQPASLSSTQVDALIEDFLGVLNPKIQTKKKNFQNKKKGGGKYTGRRMEARNRSKVPPTCHFSSVANVLFSQTFIDTAKPLTIIYK